VEPERLPAELEELAAAWRRLAPPPPPIDAEHDDLDALDAPTRAAVRWMVAAWRTVEPPAAALPWRLRLSQARPVLTRFAAAALLLASLAFLARPAWQASGEAPVTVALGRDRTELRSGPVRLILFAPPSGAAEREPFRTDNR